MEKSIDFFLKYFIGIIFLGFYFLCSCNFLLANESNFVYDSKGKRDPFISLIGKKVKLTDVDLIDSIKDVRVEGVIIDPKKGSAAIVNGQILYIGDYMGGFKLVKVTHYYIVVSRDEKEYKLQFRSEEDDKSSN